MENLIINTIHNILYRHLLQNYEVTRRQSNTVDEYVFNFNQDDISSSVLLDVLATKISPELLPSKNGEISQSTEAILGKYEYHDFFLYHLIRNNFAKDKILLLATREFKLDLSNQINLFYNRFAKNQFKRTFSPAGIKVGSVSLSPRGDFRMPDEISGI